MIIAPAIAERLRVHGFRPMNMPSIEPCSHCDSSEHIDIDYSFRSGDYTICCLHCGSTGPSLQELRGAIERWNRDHFDNRQHKKRRAERATTEDLHP